MLDATRSTLQLYFDEVAQCDVPVLKQEREWFARYVKLTDGHRKTRLKGEIAEGYLRFVIKKARDRTKHNQVLEDLIGYGNVGLLKAIDKFNPSFNNRFLTYASFWVEVEMQGFLNSRPVHVPHQTIKDQRALKRREDKEMAQGLREDYSFTEISVMSIDKLVIPIHQDVDDEPELCPDTIMQHLVASGLNRRARLVLTLLFGLRGGTPKTLDEISALLIEIDGKSATREAIREIQDAALAHLQTYFAERGIKSPWDI